EKLARVIARDLDDAALRKQRCLHGCNLPERSGSTQGGTVGWVERSFARPNALDAKCWVSLCSTQPTVWSGTPKTRHCGCAAQGLHPSAPPAPRHRSRQIPQRQQTDRPAPSNQRRFRQCALPARLRADSRAPLVSVHGQEPAPEARTCASFPSRSLTGSPDPSSIQSKLARTERSTSPKMEEQLILFGIQRTDDR